jgi:hypothetical protein
MKGRKGTDVEKPKTLVGDTKKGNVPEEVVDLSGDAKKRDDESLGE